MLTNRTENLEKIEALPTIIEETSGEIHFVTPNDIMEKIITNINPRKYRDIVSNIKS